MTVKVEAPEIQEPVKVGKVLQHSHPVLHKSAQVGALVPFTM